MTPKEKAKQLFDAMMWEGEGKEDECFKYFAKECALVAVKESLNVFSDIHKKLVAIDILNGTLEQTATFNYLEEVKKEIEIL